VSHQTIDVKRSITSNSFCRDTFASKITQQDPRCYKEELTSPKRIDQLRSTFDFLSQEKVTLSKKQWAPVRTAVARNLTTSLQVGPTTKYEEDQVSSALE